jgi:hypothetical protein
MEIPNKELFSLDEATNIFARHIDSSFTVSDLLGYVRDRKPLLSILLDTDTLTSFIKYSWAHITEREYPPNGRVTDHNKYLLQDTNIYKSIDAANHGIQELVSTNVPGKLIVHVHPDCDLYNDFASKKWPIFLG